MMEKSTVWDPLRKKEVALTPEEDVRQWFIIQLEEMMGVPRHMMMSEVGFTLGDKRLRADIVIYGRNAAPVAVIECKRPEVTLDKEVLMQAIRYNMVLNVKYIIVTNGRSTHICERKADGSGYVFTGRAPQYDEMIL